MEAFGLDLRVVKALEKISITQPTKVQSAAIPIAMEGRDLLIKARTGSGKTLAYLLPILNRLLKDGNQKSEGFSTLILVPTKELALQISDVISEATKYCSSIISHVNLGGVESFPVQKSLLLDNPWIVISTPSRIIPHLEGRSLSLRSSLKTLVIDEADLIVSFGYKEDLDRIMSFLPGYCQSILVSATLTEEIEYLQQLMLKSPAVLKLDEPSSDASISQQLVQHSIRCADEREKFLVLFVIFKLRLIRGKSIVFVNQVNSSYKVRLFLEQFSIRSCILNPELPLNSRRHIVEEFNRGAYDIVIASDSMSTPKAADERSEKKSDREFSVARGLDFKHVNCVINFDLPPDHSMYIHRVGRTARGSEMGTAYTMVANSESKALERLVASEAEQGRELPPFAFDVSQVDAFRYRVEDALRSITKIAVREARLKEIKAELLHSAKMKTHFSNNPTDLDALRHDKPMHPAKVQRHLKHIPDYLINSIRKEPPPQLVAGSDEPQKRRAESEGRNPPRKRKKGSLFSKIRIPK